MISSSAQYHQSNQRYDYDSGLEKIKRLLDFNKLSGAKILDLGCGDGRLASRLINSGGAANHVVGLEIEPEAVAKAAANGIEAVVGDLEAPLMWPDASFDLVLLLDTAEHLYNIESCLSEIKRVLKPDGHLIISFPNAFDIRNRLKLLFGGSIIHWAHEKYKVNEAWSYCHVRFPRLIDALKLMAQLGLTVEKIQYNFLGGGLISQRFTPAIVRLVLLRLWPNLMSGKFVLLVSKRAEDVVAPSPQKIWIAKTPQGL